MEVLKRHTKYACVFDITQPCELTPFAHSTGKGGWVYPVMDRVIEGIEAGDLACAEPGIEFIQTNDSFAFGRIIKSSVARALLRTTRWLHHLLRRLSDDQANKMNWAANHMVVFRHIKQLFGLTLLVVLTASQAVAQDWDKYKPRTFKQITTELAEAFFKDPDVIVEDSRKGESIVLSANTFPSQVVAVYTGSSRKVSDKKKEVIAAWLKVFVKPAEYVDLFESEYLFIEDGKEYWLPVQKQVASYFEKELRKSDKVNLYAAWIGARRDSGGTEHVFLINEFEKK